ncbi:MFS transporter [Protofrankia coriariae]|uniref:MFS transporter n=1 Tax=Protofrankia coriariae TaxID=1562887 RepID=UPI0006995344|nr:MFS transporter [Protofrankia coriariae]
MTPALRLYLVGQLPSVVCSWAQVVALSVVTVRLDPAMLGWVVATQFLPSLLLGPWFGAVADRRDRRALLVASEAGLGVVASGYAVAEFTGTLSVPVVLAIAFAWGVLNALDTPARQALIPALMPGAAARTSASSTLVLLTGMTAGSALGGWLVTVRGPGWVFGLNAVSFAADVVVLLVLAQLVPAPPRVPRTPGQIREGMRYVAATPSLRAALGAMAVIGTLAITFQVSIPLLITGTFGGGPAQVGQAFTAVSAGSLAGAIWAAARPPRRTIAAPAAAALAASLGGVAAAPHPVVALSMLAAVGVAWSTYLTSTIGALQGADPRYLGRVMSLFSVVLVGSTPVGGPITTALAAALTPRAPFIAGTGAALAGCLLLSLPHRPPRHRSWPRRAAPPGTAATATAQHSQSGGEGSGLQQAGCDGGSKVPACLTGRGVDHADHRQGIYVGASIFRLARWSPRDGSRRSCRWCHGRRGRTGNQPSLPRSNSGSRRRQCAEPWSRPVALRDHTSGRTERAAHAAGPAGQLRHQTRGHRGPQLPARLSIFRARRADHRYGLT